MRYKLIDPEYLNSWPGVGYNHEIAWWVVNRKNRLICPLQHDDEMCEPLGSPNKRTAQNLVSLAWMPAGSALLRLDHLFVPYEFGENGGEALSGFQTFDPGECS